jgi:hypothetical protein
MFTMTTSLRIHHDLYRGPKVLADPGTGNSIVVDEDLQICEMVSVGAAETRTLAAPSKAGIRFILRMLTDGGDIVVTAAAGLNVSLSTEATFADASDLLSMVSVSLTATTFRWQILEGNVGVTLA